MKMERMSSLSLALLNHRQETCNSIRILEPFILYHSLSAAEKFRSLPPKPDAQRVDGTFLCQKWQLSATIPPPTQGTYSK